MPNRPLDQYLDDLRQVRQTGAGTRETSYYPAVAAVLNAIGQTLGPKVFCLHHPSGSSGIPDFGLFEQQQFKRGDTVEWKGTIVPERGVVEVKGASHSMKTLLASKQVKDQYLPIYGLLLATNLWQFRLVRQDGFLLESFDLAPDEVKFWAIVNGVRPETVRTRFEDFLQRCLLSRAPLAKPRDLAFFLASYARDALARLAERSELPALALLRKGMEGALGIRFDGRDGDSLFRSTLVQTLFYGVFSAWVVHVRAGRGRFDWRAAQWSLTVPVARFLFQQIATPEALEPLHLVPLMDAAGETLARVDTDAFFAAFDDAQAVQYFYEPFLAFFDPDLRREMGVWYTPPEIVTYMVERVDRALRTELGVADGLADPNVWVLDPCCGTGSYVVAVIERIRRTLEDRGLGDLVGDELKAAATRRIVGFEIMTAPLVIAHWQVGEALRRAGAPLGPGERAAIFLTNALTGWQVGEAGAEIPGFEALAAERAAANSVKRDQPILVILGNPPYNAYAGVSPSEEGGLVDIYKAGLIDKWGVGKFNLDDLFVRFFRVAERRIAERSGKGIVSFISNYSWLFLPSFTVMRESLIGNFDRIWIENMHGDRTITEYGPDGRTSETVFAVEGFSAGIRQGVATTLMVRTGRSETPIYRIRNDVDASRAAHRRADLLATLNEDDFDSHYDVLHPLPANRYLLRSRGVFQAGYADWPAVDTLARLSPLPGLLEKRGGGLIGFDRAELGGRMRTYLDPAASFEDVKPSNPALAEDRARYAAKSTRQRVVREEGYNEQKLLRFCFFAFDMRWAYVTSVRPLWNEPRPQLLHALPDAKGFLAIRSQQVADPEGFPGLWTNCLADDHALHKDAFLVPVVSNLSGDPRPNLSEAAVEYLAFIGIAADDNGAAMLWHHALATLYTPAFLSENAGDLRQGWPHIPLPGNAELLSSSAALGAALAALLDADTPIPGVTQGAVRPELRTVAVPTTRTGETRDLNLSAGWGSRSAKGVTSPGRGTAEFRDYGPKEAAAAAQAATLGAQTVDVALNRSTFWSGVPEAVWECRIGGYQVLKKWLSYREVATLNRPLTAAEVGHFQSSARRIAAILMMGPDLDTVHHDCAAAHRASPAGEALAASTPADGVEAQPLKARKKG